jgi:hypothetical protein
MMKTNDCLVLCAALLASTLLVGRVAAAEVGFGDVDDLPLMPGLAAVNAQSVSFEPPVGRMVQGVAQGPVAPEAVQRFYRVTVPQLGWRPLSGDGRFVRDGELLQVEILPAPSDRSGQRQITVRFSLGPE